MPPYHFWEQPARNGSLPMNGSDFGLYILAESLGARSVIYVKDVDGIYTKNPRMYPNAKLISKVHPDELLERKLKSSCLEPMVLEVMRNARHVKRVQIINGLKRGNLTRALNLEHVGTIIQA
jgi:molybdenum storage protein